MDSPPAPVFRNPNTFMMQQEQQEDQLLQLQKRPEEEAIVGDGIRLDYPSIYSPNYSPVLDKKYS